VAPPPAHTRPRRDVGREAQALVKRYGVAAVVIAAAIVLINLVPSVSKTVTTTSTTHASTPAHVTKLPPGVTPAPTPGSAGMAVSGVKCGPGVRQIPWSHYSPICMPKWTGNNGGATSPGVTANTITITYREAASAELSLIYSIVPKAVIGTNTLAISTMQAYINTFNKEFELYGRKVVLKTFTGTGDFVTELNGSGQTEAQEDAVTAKSLGAFADSSVLDATPIYDEQLAQQKIIGLSIFGGPDSEFQNEAPYMYTTGTVCSKTVTQTEQLVNRVLSKTDSSFAGDASLNGKKRVFGFIGTATAQSEACDNDIITGLKKKYGITIRLRVNMDLSQTVQSQASSVMGEMKSDGVTTILCSTCDFFTPIFLTKSATSIGYHPEWIQTDFLTALTGLQTKQQLANMEGFGVQAEPKQTTEAYHAFKLGAPAGETIIPSYSYVYEPLLMFFDALQQAGPDLTPTTFEHAFRSLPASTPGGMYGTWSFGPTSFDPNGSYGVVRWSNTAKSAIDGLPGAWLNCNSGDEYKYDGTPPQLPEGKQLDCPASGT
jgi:hypothetical protein